MAGRPGLDEYVAPGPDSVMPRPARGTHLRNPRPENGLWELGATGGAVA